MMPNCYCGSTATFTQCCEPVIMGERAAATAEQLMRARYSAYATTNIEFLEASLHPDNRENFDAEATRQWAESSAWTGLSIIEKVAGSEEDKVGIVSFCATYTDSEEKPHQHNERAQFKKVSGNWYFCDGQIIQPNKVGRNDPCSCGSGKKYKKCCGA